jgi:putative NADH-flavin reductase
MTKIVVFGAGGHAGRAVTAEAIGRGHHVTAVVRDPARHPDIATDRVAVVAGDITDAARIAVVAAGHDAAVHAVSPVGRGQSLDDLDPRFFARAVGALLAGLADAGVGRLLVVGYAGNLEAPDGTLVMDSPALPPQFRPFGDAHTAGLTALRESDGPVDWLMLTPPMDFDTEGARTGRYRIGGDAAPAAGSPADHISYADFAQALVDQVDTPTHHRTRISVTG